MRILEALGLAVAMLLAPLTIQNVVLCLDALHEFMGRRAQSPYVPVSWVGVVFAVGFVLGWHVWLGRLSYLVVLENGEGKAEGNGHAKRSTERGLSWGRVLGRILVPALLIVLAGGFVWDVVCRVRDPMPFVTANAGAFIGEVR